jgi:hypothetical protein
MKDYKIFSRSPRLPLIGHTALGHDKNRRTPSRADTHGWLDLMTAVPSNYPCSKASDIIVHFASTNREDKKEKAVAAVARHGDLTVRHVTFARPFVFHDSLSG